MSEKTLTNKASHSIKESENRFIQLHKDIAVIANQNQSVERAMEQALERVCRETRWPVGHIYFTAKDSSQGLVPSFLWYLKNPEQFEVFRKVTNSTPLSHGVGLPGRVLAKGKPAWIPDVTEDQNFPRARLAKNIGVRAGFAFPILIGTEVVGVMEFFSAKAKGPDNHLLEIMSHIGTLLGRVIERKRSELALKKQQKEQAVIFNSVPAMIWYVNKDFKIIRINQEACSFAQKSVNELEGMSSYEVFPFQGNPGLDEDLQIIQTGKSLCGILRSFERGSNDLRWIQMDKVPYLDENGSIQGIIIFALDITEQKHAEEVSMWSLKKLRQLYRRMERVREEERTRIAREVHDELGQVLTSTKLELSVLDKKLLKTAPEHRQKTKVILELMENTIQTVKSLSMELRPPILDVFGLSDAIRWQGEEFQNRTNSLVNFEFEPSEIHIDSERSTTMFRIFQETLTNIARHANAKKIDVKLLKNDDSLILQVCDDGKGITEQQISDINSLGILGMRERALVWGGKVHFEGLLDSGTTVTIELPMEKT